MSSNEQKRSPVSGQGKRLQERSLSLGRPGGRHDFLGRVPASHPADLVVTGRFGNRSPSGESLGRWRGNPRGSGHASSERRSASRKNEWSHPFGLGGREGAGLGEIKPKDSLFFGWFQRRLVWRRFFLASLGDLATHLAWIFSAKSHLGGLAQAASLRVILQHVAPSQNL